MAKTSYNLDYKIGPDLREVPVAPTEMQAYVDTLIAKIRELQVGKPRLPGPGLPVEPGENARALVKLLGEIGAYSKMLGKLEAAERALEKSLALIDEHHLGVDVWAVHTLRFADVRRFQGQALDAETAFRSVLVLRERHPSLAELEDFAWQHLGKLHFDLGEWDKAEEAFTKALELRRRKNLPELVASTETALKATRLKRDSLRPPKKR